MKKNIWRWCLGCWVLCASLFAQEAQFDFAQSPFAFGAEATEVGNAAATDIEITPCRENPRTFTVFVKISMQPGWHVYWKNPGEAGMPLSIEWKDFPAGVTFGNWSWSTPKFYELQGLASYVYEDVAYIGIPVEISEDLVGKEITLAGTASWLACDDNGCFPQEKDFSVKLGNDVLPSERFLKENEVYFPYGLELNAAYRENAKTPTLILSKKDGTPLDASFRFFPEREKFSATAATVVPVEKNGVLTFNLPLNDGEKIDAAGELSGVLVAPDGRAFEIYPFEIKPAGLSASLPSLNFSFDFAFLGLLLLAFAGGLILNLMPCVFPVLGLKIMHFVGKSGSDKKKIARHGFVFGAGVLISFWILAGVLTILRSGGEQLGWGFQLQEPGFVYGMILLMLVFGLSMSGVFEFGVAATGVGGKLTEKSGYAGSFFSGVLAVIIATPCAAPFLAPALGSALTLPAVPSFALFTAIALGLAAPYVILSCVPALLKFLPKPGAWMETFKQTMAFLLYAPALYFVWVLMGQIEDSFAQRDLLISFAVVALACWIYGKWAQPWRSRVSRVAGTLVAVVLFAGTVIYAGNLLYGKKSDEWVAWSPEAQARALDEGKIVYVDFTARWCATCQVNKRVYSDEALQKEFADANVVKMRADWTNKNPTIAAELEKYGRAAVPVNVFLKKDADPVVLGELFAGPSTVSAGLLEILDE